MGLMASIKKVTAEVVVLLLIFGCSAYYYLEVAALPSQRLNLLLIQPVFVVIAVSTFALIILKLREALKSPVSIAPKREAFVDDIIQAKLSSVQESSPDPTFIKNGIAFGVCTLVFVVLFDRLGFMSSSFLYLATLIYMLGSRSFLVVIVLPAAVVGFLYITMVIMLRFPMPQGILI